MSPMVPGPPSTRFLTVRFQWNPLGLMFFSSADVMLEASLIGTVKEQQSLAGAINFEWDGQSFYPGAMDPFALRAQVFAALNNRYDVWSTSRGQSLGVIRDHQWNLLGTKYVSVECEAGHFEITETLASRLLGHVRIGVSRQFTIKGSVTGTIDLNGWWGFREFVVILDNPHPDVAALNAVMTASVIILTRAVHEHDSGGDGSIVGNVGLDNLR